MSYLTNFVINFWVILCNILIFHVIVCQFWLVQQVASLCDFKIFFFIHHLCVHVTLKCHILHAHTLFHHLTTWKKHIYYFNLSILQMKNYYKSKTTTSVTGFCFNLIIVVNFVMFLLVDSYRSRLSFLYPLSVSLVSCLRNIRELNSVLIFKFYSVLK